MTLIQDMRAAMPGLRDALPDMRETIPDLREWSPSVSDIRAAMPDLRAVMPDLRGALPDAREALPAIRDSLSDLRADLPGPWRRERPPLLRRIAIVVVAGVAITLATWLLMAFFERRRLSRMAAMEVDETAIERAEGEGMGIATASSAGTSPAATSPTGTSTPGSSLTSTSTTGSSLTGSSPQVAGVRPTPGIDMDAIRPLVGARTNPSDGGTTDGR